LDSDSYTACYKGAHGFDGISERWSMMKTCIGSDGTLETDYSDESLKRAHESEQPTVENAENPGYSKKILKMVKDMQEGSIADNNKWSRKIVKAQNKERKKMDRKNKKAAKVVKPPAKPVQRNIMDF
jgi:hypothetical protein